MRAAGRVPRSVESASMLCFGSAFVAGFLSFIALFLLAPRDPDPSDAIVDATIGIYLLVVSCLGVGLCGILARRGSAWPRWALAVVAATELLLIGRVPLLWLAFIGVAVAAATLWGPAARAFARSLDDASAR